MLSVVRAHIKEIATFVLVGIANTIVDLAVLNVLLGIFGSAGAWNFAIFKSVSFLAAVTNSYFLNKHFTFSHKENSIKTFSSFLMVSIISFFINVGTASLAFSFLTNTAEISIIIAGNIAALFGTCTSLSINYFGYKFLVFKKSHVKQSE